MRSRRHRVDLSRGLKVRQPKEYEIMLLSLECLVRKVTELNINRSNTLQFQIGYINNELLNKQ